MLSHNPLLQSALAYAKAGFRVFPCRPGGKEPVPGLKWKQEATLDPQKIQQWWTETPQANIGVVPGNDYLILDIDCKPGKPSGFETLGGILSQCPPTWTVRTPSGGEHRYFQCPPGWKPARKHGPGFDVIHGNGMYVLGPPSRLGIWWMGEEYKDTRGEAS